MVPRAKLSKRAENAERYMQHACLALLVLLSALLLVEALLVLDLPKPVVKARRKEFTWSVPSLEPYQYDALRKSSDAVSSFAR